MNVTSPGTARFDPVYDAIGVGREHHLEQLPAGEVRRAPGLVVPRNRASKLDRSIA